MLLNRYLTFRSGGTVVSLCQVIGPQMKIWFGWKIGQGPEHRAKVRWWHWLFLTWSNDKVFYLMEWWWITTRIHQVEKDQIAQLHNCKKFEWLILCSPFHIPTNISFAALCRVNAEYAALWEGAGPTRYKIVWIRLSLKHLWSQNQSGRVDFYSLFLDHVLKQFSSEPGVVTNSISKLAICRFFS